MFVILSSGGNKQKQILYCEYKVKLNGKDVRPIIIKIICC